MPESRSFWEKIIRKALVLTSGAFFLLACFLLTFCQNSEKQSENEAGTPETTTSLTYLNHDPGVKYTGRGSCVSCHKEIHDDYLHTGKGRSFYLPSRSNIIEDFSKATVYDSYTNLGYRAFWRGNDMMIAEYRTRGRDTIHYREEKVDYIIGSGNQTRSYLLEQNGYFYEMPITWYVSKGIWDLSPGYEKGANSGFSRTIGQQCMDCHNSDYQFVDHSVNKFTSVGLGMSCEKCHGPGEAHIKAMEAGKAVAKGEIDRTIVNPAKLPIQLQFDVCRQCHLEGITVPKAGKDPLNFRPGMAL
ncbi:MAG: hypothetical protein LPJ89_05680, partial [Hymenobacteraceae bacterium]|nr:hypothetical protein [Hymenobacteraceae bacterium]